MSRAATLGRGMKRRATVPPSANRLACLVSKADLLEAAWHLASLVNGGEGCDDDTATLARLIEELNLHRARRGGRVVDLAKLDAKIAKRRADQAAFTAELAKRRGEA